MGTRNITRVILDGQIRVDQYCQWDGYPTGQGENVMEFVKQYCNGWDLEEFKKRLVKSTLLLTKAGSMCCTGARPMKIMDKLEKIRYGQVSTIDMWVDQISSGAVAKEEVSYYLSASRNTGSDILFWLMKQEPNGMFFFTTDYTYNMSYELDWQIEGMYVIDIDNETVTIDYHGKTRSYSFEAVHAMTEKEIMEEMDNFEKGDDEECSVETIMTRMR